MLMDFVNLQMLAAKTPSETWLYVGLVFGGILLLGLVLIVAKALRNRYQKTGGATGFTHEDLDSIRNQLSDEELSRLKRALAGVDSPRPEKQPKSDSQLSTSGENDDANSGEDR